jgi:hypothetical protein
VTALSVYPVDLNVYRQVYTDGSGWYGLAELPPGNYRVTLGQEGSGKTRVTEITVQPGQVSEANFNQ